ncbi:MAG: hypothetical protein V4585_23080 [Bacteroidota bacterium]
MFNKMFFLVLFLGIINHQSLFAQQIPAQLLILKQEQFPLPNRKFYIQKIVCDFNQPKYFLTRRGIFNKQRTITFGDSLQKVLMRYIKPSNTYRAGLVPITIRIKELKIREQRHFLNEEGMAKIVMDFYVETDYKPLRLFHTDASRIYTGFMNISAEHEENFREIVKSCLLDFNNAKVDYSKFVIPNKIFKAKHTPY